MQQLELFDFRRDVLFERDNQIARFYDVLSETKDGISYAEHIDPKKTSFSSIAFNQDFNALFEGRNKLAVDQHLQVLEKFGRYPQRNAQYGRESTPNEIAWLNDKDNLPMWAGGKLPFDQRIK